MPDWFPVIDAAVWGGIAPWELAERHKTEPHWAEWLRMHKQATLATRGTGRCPLLTGNS